MSLSTIGRRLVEILAMQPDGQALCNPIQPLAVITAAACIGRWGGEGVFTEDLHAYPTPEGGVQLEWERHGIGFEAEFKIADGFCVVSLVIGPVITDFLTPGEATRFLIAQLEAS